MPHADSATLPAHIRTKAEFWDHVHAELNALLVVQRHWVSNLANASALLYNSLLAFPEFGSGAGAVNWCGFYIDSSFFPSPLVSQQITGDPKPSARLLLGPFCGKPACQFINTAPGKAKGVCAEAYIQQKTVLVPDVGTYPGHIACDGETQSEIVCPLIVEKGASRIAVGILDLDCLALNGFNEDDRRGLEKIAKLVSEGCDW